MTYFLRLIPKMPVFVFVLVLVLVFLERPALGSFDLLSEVSGREELVKWAGYGEEKLSTVVVAGRILCHAAGARDGRSINPLPVSGARVGVVCGTNRNTNRKGNEKRRAEKRLSLSGKGKSDDSGRFLIDVPSHLHAIPNLEKVCHVRVVDIPASSRCRRACAAKHNKPITLSSIGHGTRTYTTNNIHLTQPNS